jgi:polyribonucleotide nucleotidyltransferase
MQLRGCYGLVSKSDNEYVILTDIVGLEDFSGEMDFKIAGTKEGITAIQLDVKNKGLTAKMIHEIFERAQKARLHILSEMKKYLENQKQIFLNLHRKLLFLLLRQIKSVRLLDRAEKISVLLLRVLILR